MSLDNYKSHTSLRTRPEYKRKAVYTLHEDSEGGYGAKKLGKNGSDVDFNVDIVGGKAIGGLPASKDPVEIVDVDITHSEVNSGSATTLKFYRVPQGTVTRTPTLDGVTYTDAKQYYRTYDASNDYQLYPDGNARWKINKYNSATSSYDISLCHLKTTDPDRRTFNYPDYNRNVTGTPLDYPTEADWVAATGTLTALTVKEACKATVAYSLRRVADSPKADQVIFDTKENKIQGSVGTTISDANAVPIDSVHTGLKYRSFENNMATDADNSIVFQDNLIRVTANNTGTATGAYVQVFRFDGLTTDNTYTIKGEARVTDVNISGTNAVAQAFFNTQDGNGGVGIITSSEFQPFSITHKATVDTHDFIDLEARVASTSGATDLTGSVTAEYRNIQIIKNPTQVVKVRRGDQVEADVFVDRFGNTSVDSPIQNTVEHLSPPGAGTAYDTHFTAEKTLGKFLQSKETNPITIASTYESSAESFSVSDNGFSVKVLDDVSGQPNNTVRFCRPIDSTIKEYDSKVTKFTVSFNVTKFKYSGGGTPASVKGSNNTTGSSSWFFEDKDGVGLGAAANITKTGKHYFVGYGKLDNVNNTDGTLNFDFRSLVFIAQQGLEMTVEDIELTIDHAATVPCWYDQAAVINNGNHAVQDDEQKQPYLAKYGEVLTDNGKATIEFPNTATNAYYKLVAPAPLENLNSCSIYAVSSTKSTNTLAALTYSQIFTHGNYSNDERFYIAKKQNLPNWYVGYGDGFHDSGVAIVANKQHIFSIHGGASEMSAHIDGVEVLRQASENNDLQNTQVVIGQHTINNNDAAYDGNISELIYYREDLNASAPIVEANLAAYYGTGAVPTTMAAIRGVSGVSGNDSAKITLGIFLDKYEEALNGEVSFKYFVPSGHAAVGKYWHIGASSETHTGTASEPIVGGQWTKAIVSFGSLFSGSDKAGAGNVPNRFLIVSSQREAANVASGNITVVTPNEDILLADIVVYSISDHTSQSDLSSKTEGGYSKVNYTYGHN